MVWAILRGDWGTIKIGKNTSVQENVTIHIEIGKSVIIGADCIIGHHSMIHGPCEVENGCLVGIGSNILQNSKLSEGSLLAAGATLVNKEIPPRSLAVGTPADVKKSLPVEDKLIGARTAGEYAKNGKSFKEFFEKNPEYTKYWFFFLILFIYFEHMQLLSLTTWILSNLKSKRFTINK